MTVTGVMFGIFFALTFVPFLAGGLGYDYLVLVLVMDIIMVWCAVTLIKTPVIEEGRRQMVWLNMAWGFL